jgi:hypothetical protein
MHINFNKESIIIINDSYCERDRLAQQRLPVIPFTLLSNAEMVYKI